MLLIAYIATNQSKRVMWYAQIFIWVFSSQMSKSDAINYLEIYIFSMCFEFWAIEIIVVISFSSEPFDRSL